jgi:DUF971 family protein
MAQVCQGECMSVDQPTSPADSRTEPSEIAVRDAARTLTITWGDGHISRYPFWFLRGFCPCAVCQGHGGGLQFVGEAEGVGPDLATIDDVGHYAMNLTWSDGHKTGIYTLDALRNLCPCAVCRQEPLGQTVLACLPDSRKQTLGEAH